MSFVRSQSCVEALEVRRLLTATDLDTSFGTGGKTLLDHVTDSADYVSFMALTPDNKLLVAGRSDVIAGENATLTRFNLDGSLDRTFGQGGKDKLSLPADFAGMVMNSDGSVTTLSSATGSGIPLAQRYTANGVLDSTFTIGVNPSGTPHDLQPDGTQYYLVVGNSIARINANGSADTTFGTNGVLTIPSEPNFVQFAPQKIAALPDGSFMVGGTYGSTSSGVRRGAFRHYSATGVLDTTFGISGTLQLNQLSTNVSVGKLQRLSSGEFQAIVTDNNQQGYIVRFISLGAWDGGWGTGGLATVNPNTSFTEAIADAVQDSSSRWLGVGFVRGSTIATRQEFLFRLNSNGTIDTTFGTNGYVQGFTASDDVNWGNFDLALPGNGNLYLATALEEQWVDPTVNEYLYRFNAASGAWDTSFGTNGSVITSYTASSAQTVTASAQLSDGGFAFVGNQFGVGKSQMIVGKLTADGQPAQFGQNGSLELDFGTYGAKPFAVAGQSDGKILVGGDETIITNPATGSMQNVFALARLNSDGSLDPNFGAGGEVTSSFNGYTFERFTSLAVDSSGYIYASGDINGQTYGAVVRYTSTGQLDTSFGTGGLQILSMNGIDIPTKILSLPNGQLLVIGFIDKTSSPYDDVFLTRLNHDGSVDSSFGSAGLVSFDLDNDYNDSNQMAIDPAGRIYVSTFDASYDTLQVRRYSPSGQLDPTFGTNGITTFTNLTTFASANDLKLSGSGKLLVYGETTSSPSDLYIMAFNTDGTIATSFGANGKATFDLSSNDSAVQLFVQPNGKWVLTGESDGAITYSDFSAERLFGEALDTTPPTMSASELTSPRPQSVVTFSEKVTPPNASSLLLISQTNGNHYSIPQSWISYNASTMQLTISPDATLPDDNYQLQIAGGSVIDFTGNTQPNSFTANFFFLTADANGDRTVNALDFNALATNYGKPGTFAQGDFDFSGTVNSSDFALLAARYGKTLAAPSGAPLPMSAQSANLFADKSIDDSTPWSDVLA